MEEEHVRRGVGLEHLMEWLAPGAGLYLSLMSNAH